MEKYTTYVGLDVHARSIAIRALNVETGEKAGTVLSDCPSAADVMEWLRERLDGPYYLAYESGCTGFHLCRELRALGADCDVIAVTTLARSVKDQQNKNDRVDARAILREIVSPMPEYSVVWVPDEETEAARMLARAYDAAVVDLKRKKQRLIAFLLVMGYTWNERTATGNLRQRWTGPFRDWLDSISFGDPAAQAAYDLHRRAVDDAGELVDRASGLIRTEAAKPRWKPYVDALCRMKGVDVLSAFLVAAEIGDFERFESGRKVSSWLGTTPAESSSGERESHGRITKAGNSYVRRTLVEGNAGMSRRRTSRKKPDPGASVPEGVESMARKANARLKRRFEHLTGEGLHPNKARVAVASEQVRWMWAIGRAVQRGLAAEGAAAV